MGDCIVKGCPNCFDEGQFNGPICWSCFDMLQAGTVGPGKTFVHQMQHTLDLVRGHVVEMQEVLMSDPSVSSVQEKIVYVVGKPTTPPGQYDCFAGPFPSLVMALKHLGDEGQLILEAVEDKPWRRTHFWDETGQRWQAYRRDTTRRKS